MRKTEYSCPCMAYQVNLISLIYCDLVALSTVMTGEMCVLLRDKTFRGSLFYERILQQLDLVSNFNIFKPSPLQSCLTLLLSLSKNIYEEKHIWQQENEQAVLRRDSWRPLIGAAYSCHLKRYNHHCLGLTLLKLALSDLFTGKLSNVPHVCCLQFGFSVKLE